MERSEFEICWSIVLGFGVKHLTLSAFLHSGACHPAGGGGGSKTPPWHYVVDSGTENDRRETFSIRYSYLFRRLTHYLCSITGYDQGTQRWTSKNL